MRQLREIIAAIEEWFEPRWAQAWDAVGLVCGDPAESVERILLAVDVVPATVAEAEHDRAQLLLAHHPLLLSAVHGVPADDPKGALVHRMIRGGIACFAAHTNADVADPGVSDALARRLGLRELRPIEPAPSQALDKLVVFVPIDEAGGLIDVLAEAGAGHIGDYDRCAWTTQGEGTFRPGVSARPAIGVPGQIATVSEARIEMVLPQVRRAQVLAALLDAHSYEQPAFDLVPMAELPSSRGMGRIGELGEPVTLAEFLSHAARVLPATVWGLRAAGRADQQLRTVGVCGGSGASLIEAARAGGADAYLSADLKHHAVLDAVSTPPTAGAHPREMALIDAAHWATEAPWLDALADRLRTHFGTTVNVTVSTQVTDPWSLHVPSIESSPSRP